MDDLTESDGNEDYFNNVKTKIYNFKAWKKSLKKHSLIKNLNFKLLIS